MDNYRIIKIMKLVCNNKIIFEGIKIVKKEKDRIRGLMFRFKKKGIFFETRFGIHSFFVFYSLTIFICDDEWKIVKIKKKLIPFAFFFWNPKYKRVIELPYKEYGVKMGDKLEIVK
jgi:uncharacterized membrane protein (UPF0127 family)